ncbi:glycosyl transferase [Thalassobius sp. Cn5-15]|uniref:glycosyl transferase n=1 Tax=Thalassobius sp. Cn5-15 TaxID=2917763 RepID=UPI001EF243DB|nr:glycosyl transferase [Thalassobius sp. Cn5-15]MCG7493332.1 glycosyl transferase [Thalassobius sp. Cn5-15]
MEKQIVCINWGTKYGAPYVNRLYKMVEANITPPFRFVCFTDNSDDFLPEIDCFDLPPMPGFMPKNTLGKWPKSRLWAPELGDLKGAFLFIDLDVVITGSLDSFFEYGDPDDVVLARNAAKPLHRLGQTSIYRMPVGALAPLQQIFANDPQAVADKYRFEQHFVTKNAPNGIKFWPRTWVQHFRIQCIPRFPLNYFTAPKVPRDCRVVIFAGSLNPPDAMVGQYKETLPHLPRRAHIKRAFSMKRPLRALRQFYFPAKWVSDIWGKADASTAAERKTD